MPSSSIQVPFCCIPQAASLAVSQKSSRSDVTGPARVPGRWEFDVQNIISAYLLVMSYNPIHFLGMKLPWSIYSTQPKIGFKIALRGLSMIELPYIAIGAQ